MRARTGASFAQRPVAGARTGRVDVEVQVAIAQVAEARHLGAERANPRSHLLDEIVELV